MEDLLIKAATLVAVGLAAFSSFPGTARPDPSAAQKSPSHHVRPSASYARSRPTAGFKLVTGELVSRLDDTSQSQDFRPTAGE